MTNLAENRDLVRRYVQALDSHDLEAAGRLVADDLVNHAAIPEAQGSAGMRTILQKLIDAMPDMRWTVEDVVAEGDRVVCRVSVRGTQTGPLHFSRYPLPPTGRSFTSEHIHMMRIANGKVAEHWAGRDDMGMLRQLGHLPLGGAVKS